MGRVTSNASRRTWLQNFDSFFDLCCLRIVVVTIYSSLLEIENMLSTNDCPCLSEIAYSLVHSSPRSIQESCEKLCRVMLTKQLGMINTKSKCNVT